MNSKIFQEKSKVVYTRKIADNTFETMLYSPRISQYIKPGQFINILPSKNWEPMMRRPMSVASQDKDNISIIYKVVGKGTELMQSWEVNEIVDILGPLGNFWIEYENYNPILIGGGVGIAPIINLKKHLDSLNTPHILIMGARTKSEHFLSHNPDKGIYVSTDDGSLGVSGTVIDALNTIDYNVSDTKIFACGPPGMMEAVKDFSINKNIVCDLAVETVMACGIGICQGCTVELDKSDNKRNSYREKYVLACIDGPIFRAKDIKTCYL